MDELAGCTASDYCPRCGVDVSRYAIVGGVCPRCQGYEFYFDGIARVGIYSEPLRKMILDFKHGRTELIGRFAFFANTAMDVSSFKSEIDFFVPVPLHWLARLRRGYNQSHLLAMRLTHDNAKVNTDLVRIRRTRRQADMETAAARARNVAGAFAVRRGNNFHSSNICLVDDIKTTGATLNECAKTLKEAGASKVFAIVLAVAGQDSA